MVLSLPTLKALKTLWARLSGEPLKFWELWETGLDFQKSIGKQPICTVSVCYEIITGKIPFDDCHFCYYDGVISRGERPELPDHVSGPLKDIILGCWHSDPSCRPNFTDILESLKQCDTVINMCMGPVSGMLQGMESGNPLQWKEEIILNMGSFDDEAKARDMTLFAPVFEHMESGFVGSGDAGTPESRLLQLKKVAAIHIEINVEEKAGQANYAYWASKYAATLDQFISEFGWKLITSHLFLPFAKYVERRRLLVLLTQQFTEFFHTFQEAVDVQFQLDASRYDTSYFLQRFEIAFLMKKLHEEILEGLEQCQLEEHDDLPLSEKLTIVEDSMKSILDAEVQRDLILLSLRDLILQTDPEHTNREIQMFHMAMGFITFVRQYRKHLMVLKTIIQYLVYLAQSGDHRPIFGDSEATEVQKLKSQ